MKFVLVVLLSVCVLSANARRDVFAPADFQLATRSGFVETIQEFIQKLVLKAQEAVDALMQKAEEIFNKLSKDLQNILVSALNTIKDIIAKLEEDLGKLPKQRKDGKDCFDQYRSELEEVFAKAKEDITKCVNDAREHIKHIPDSIRVHIDAIKEQIGLLRDIIHECFEPTKPVSSILCALKKGNEIAKSINSIVSGAYDVLKVATQESINIVAETSKCVQGAVAEVKEHVHNIREKIYECIKTE